MKMSALFRKPSAGRSGPPRAAKPAVAPAGPPVVRRGGRLYKATATGTRHPHIPSGEMINVGVMVNFGDGGYQPSRFRWPSTITEEQAIVEVLKTLRNEDLRDICEMHFSQAPRGNLRISWLDDEPKGNYYFNQHVFGEGGLQSKMSMNEDLIAYDPDIPGIQNQGTIAGYGGQQGVEPQERVGPVVRYDPDDVWGGQAPQQQQQQPGAYLTPRY